MSKKNEYNIYCDESCHLEHDHQKVMVLGAVWCPKISIKRISMEIRELKKKYNAKGELKWVKMSKSKSDFYKELIKYFFRNNDLHFRCLVVNDKSKLNHGFFNQGSHDTFYYKMYFSMLRTILNPINKHNIYIDIKDTRSELKIQKLKEVLCNNVFDFTSQMISKIQHIRSNESELMQLSDLLIGAIAYENRKLKSNDTKVLIVKLIEKEINQSVCFSTSLYCEKFNIFIFSPQEII